MGEWEWEHLGTTETDFLTEESLFNHVPVTRQYPKVLEFVLWVFFFYLYIMKTTDHRKDCQLWQWAFTFIIHQTFALQEHCYLQAQHFISVPIGVSIFLGCGSLLTIVLEMVS